MRYKEYNTNMVLEKCIPLFWANGFRGTSIQEIVKVTGVNRFSLYHEFHNKEGILYSALQLYNQRYAKHNIALLVIEGELKQVLLDFYLSFLLNERQFQGCFYIHIGTELADEDPKIKQLIESYLAQLSMAFEVVLLNCEATKEEAKFYARHLVGLFCTSMSFCLIHSEQQKQEYIKNGIEVILHKTFSHASST